MSTDKKSDNTMNSFKYKCVLIGGDSWQKELYEESFKSLKQAKEHCKIWNKEFQREYSDLEKYYDDSESLELIIEED